jgi:hypothetical protein
MFTLATVESTSNVGNEPAIIVEADGTVQIAHFDDTNNDLRLATRPSGGSWAGAALDTTGTVGRGAAIGVDPSGGLHIVYEDASARDLRYIFRDPVGMFGDPSAVLTSGRVGRWNGLSVDGMGSVHVATYSETGSTLEYATRPSGGLWTLEPIDDIGEVGEYASIAAQPDGTLHAVAFDRSQLLDALGRPTGRVYDLRYARRPAGGAWAAETIDERGDVGRYARVATTAEGFVYVVYVDATNNDLRVMRRCP